MIYVKGEAISKEAQPLVDYREPLKHVLCTALIYIQALSQELKKLDLKEKQEDNDSEKLKTATILHNMMVTVNDIIHPAHQHLYEMFPGDEKLYDELIKYFKQNKSAGIVFKGCMCNGCSQSGDESGRSDKGTQTEPTEKL